MDSMRRVVTGIDENGKSVFVSDEQVEALVPAMLGGNRIFRLWGDDAPSVVPNDGAHPSAHGFFPEGADGYRYIIFSMPPEAEVTVPEDMDAAFAEMERLTPGMGNAVTDASGVHYTATVDLEYILEGEVTLVLDDGAEKTLGAGTSLIQCGARHAWYNRSSARATILLVFIAAELDESRFAPGAAH